MASRTDSAAEKEALALEIGQRILAALDGEAEAVVGADKLGAILTERGVVVAYVGLMP